LTTFRNIPTITLMAHTPAALAERAELPKRVSGAALGNQEVAALLEKHFPGEFVSPARVKIKALDDPRVIRLMEEHRPDLVIERARTGIKIAVLRARREAMDLTPDEFAAQVGLSTVHYRNIELGHKQPNVRDLGRIVERLGCPLTELLAA